MRSFFDSPVVHDALIAIATAVVSAIAGLLARKKEKSKLRKRGYLKDGKF